MSMIVTWETAMKIYQHNFDEAVVKLAELIASDDCPHHGDIEAQQIEVAKAAKLRDRVAQVCEIQNKKRRNR